MKRLLIVVVCISIGTILSGTRTWDINRELLLMSYIIHHQLAANNARRLEEAAQPVQLRPQVIPVQQQQPKNTPKKLFSKKQRCHELKNNRKDRSKHAQHNKCIQQPRQKGRK